jgi:hypothetical protein
MRFSLLLLLFLPSCFFEPSKEELIEYCADYRNFSYAKDVMGNDNFKILHYAWRIENTSFKDKYKKLYNYKGYVKYCENMYNKAPVEFKLRYADIRKEIGRYTEEQQWNLSKADHKLMKKLKKEWKESLKK